MAGKEFSNEERAFVAELALDGAGLTAEALMLLTDGAEPLSPEQAERIRLASRAKAKTRVAQPARTAPAPRSRRRLLTAAAVILLGLGATVVATNPDQAVAAVKRLFHLIPGMGIQETTQQTLVMAAPVTVSQGGLKLTVTGLLSDDQSTHITFQIEGIPQDKAAFAGQPGGQDTFGLTLPDGTRLPSTSSVTSVGSDYRADLWFLPLPPATGSVTLHVPAITSQAEPFDVTIPVSDVAGADLPEALAGGWAAEQHGVRVGVPDVAFDGDAITVRVQGVTTDPKSRLSMVGTIGEGMERFAPTLTDDRGRPYPRDEKARVWDNPGDFSLRFTGPVAEGARRLTLRVPAVEVTEEAAGKLTIGLAKLPVGATEELKQTLKIGEHTFLIRSATRESADRLRLDLDLGPEVDGVRLVRFGRLEPSGQSLVGFGYSWTMETETWQLRAVWFDITSDADSVSFWFKDPVLRVQGPWAIDLPVG